MGTLHLHMKLAQTTGGMSDVAELAKTEKISDFSAAAIP